ncbi:GNAT family protein [Pricia sp. S334]|uniref:GNAT family protein n=1 Tax=Pricia mediterranea TaxID=3076079 RepID=A0ABU3L350_9FLAO|nr:GNAT family protein [Pricia sp. S334]MDT7828060.1 GNAT family protein [Pricia sp. S334]
MVEIILRTLKPSDKTQIALLANNKKIWDNVRDAFGHPYTEKNAEEFIQRQAKSDTEDVFAIDCQGELCGLIGLILQNDIYRKSAEIGYWIGEPFWGKGIVTKAIELITIYAFDKLILIRIFAGVFEYNVASMRVLEKNGFQKEGIAKKAVFKNGEFWDEHRYGLLSPQTATR